jgi:SAM-dependent methyltransferase
MNHAYNLADQYNIYYQGGKNSAYNKRFGQQKFTFNEQRQITDSIIRLAPNVNCVFNILDFGCGDGRVFPIIETIAGSYSYRNMKFNFIGYDISIGGLNEFRQELVAKGFSMMPEAHPQILTTTKSQIKEDKARRATPTNVGERQVNDVMVKNDIWYKLTKNNITVTLVHGVSKDQPLLEQFAPDGYHLIMCLFGVLSHIAGRENRLQMLESQKTLLHDQGELIVTVPTHQRFRKEQGQFKQLRLQYHDNPRGLDKYLKQAREDGDIYYQVAANKTASGQTIYNYYHLFSLDELTTDIKAVNFNVHDIAAASYGDPCKITNHYLINLLDYWCALTISSTPFARYFVNKFAQYISITIKK